MNGSNRFISASDKSKKLPLDIKAVLIDVDDTLLDFDRSSALAMEKCLISRGYVFNDEMFATFKRRNKELWHQVEQNTLTVGQLLERRWNIVFNDLKIKIDGVEFEKDFTDKLFDIAVPMEGAEDALGYLHERYVVAAASNAMTNQQTNRLKISGLHRHIDKLFASESLGVGKPSVEFFEKCLCGLNVDRRNVVMIGDSQRADIVGACGAGIAAVWFDHKKSGETCDDAVATITSLREIKELL